MPASGASTLYNVAGTVTAPASGDHFTYTNGGDGQVYTISAASMKVGNGGGGATTTGNGATAANGGGTTATGSLHL